MKSFRLSGFAILLIAGLAGQANAAPIVNGDFETPLSPNANFLNYAVGTATLTGWNVVGPVGEVVSIVNTNFVQNGVAFHAQSGNQWLDLTGFNNNNTEGVSQSVTTIIGDVYQLSLWVGNTTGGSIFGTTSTVNVQLNGSAFHSAVNSDVNTTGLSWEQYTYLFTATGLSTTLAFLNGDPSGDNSNGLDNIVLTDLGPAGTERVPEPMTIGLFGAGLAGLAGMRRRRKAAKAE